MKITSGNQDFYISPPTNENLIITEKDFKNEAIHIFIKVDDKHTFDIAVYRTDRINNVIDKIKEKCGMSGNSPKLMHSGIYLDEEWTIDECDFVNGSMLYLMNGLGGGMQIFIKNIEGKIYTIEVASTDTIGDIKNKVYEKSGFAPREQRLVFRGNCLADYQTVKELELDAQSEINLVIRTSDNIRVHCKWQNGRDIVTEVQTSDTVNELKRLICQEMTFGMGEIDLLFNQTLLSGHDLIRDCGLINESEVNVISKKNTYGVIGLIVASVILFLAYELFRLLRA